MPYHSPFFSSSIGWIDVSVCLINGNHLVTCWKENMYEKNNMGTTLHTSFHFHLNPLPHLNEMCMMHLSKHDILLLHQSMCLTMLSNQTICKRSVSTRGYAWLHQILIFIQPLWDLSAINCEYVSHVRGEVNVTKIKRKKNRRKVENSGRHLPSS